MRCNIQKISTSTNKKSYKNPNSKPCPMTFSQQTKKEMERLRHKQTLFDKKR